MRLTGEEYRVLSAAFKDAFSDYDALAVMLKEAGYQISEFAAPGALPTVILRVIEHF